MNSSWYICFDVTITYIYTVCAKSRFQGITTFVDLFYFVFIFVILSCLYLAALWSPVGNRLISWLSYMWCFLVFLVIFPYGVLGQA